LYPAGSPLEDLSLGCDRLAASAGRKRLGVELVEFRKPTLRVGDERLEQHSLRHATDAHAVSLETEFFGQADGLTAAVLEEFGDVGFGHGVIETSPNEYISIIYIFRGACCSEFAKRSQKPLRARFVESHPFAKGDGAPGYW
jgi:hypothetical protein